MSGGPELSAWFCAGILLGGIHLACLWVSVRQALRRRSATILMAGAFCRLGVLVSAGALAFQLRPPFSALIAAVVGFVLVRFAVLGVFHSVGARQIRSTRDGNFARRNRAVSDR